MSPVLSSGNGFFCHSFYNVQPKPLKLFFCETSSDANHSFGGDLLLSPQYNPLLKDHLGTIDGAGLFGQWDGVIVLYMVCLFFVMIS